MRIILIGNYKKDHQESMQRFTSMLYTGFIEAGIKTEIWKPVLFFGFFFQHTGSGIGKWFGYLDKWILFPLILRVRVLFLNTRAGNVHFHICDHSNAPYLTHLPIKKTVITCHDVIAIRSSLGSAGTGVKVSNTGVFLQKWILKNLKKAEKIATVSDLTLRQLRELTQGKNEEWCVIYNAFNDRFWIMDRHEAISVLSKNGINTDEPFILHVGSGHARKNRKILIDTISKGNLQYNIYYAGEKADQGLMNHAKQSGLEKRIVSIVKPDHKTLVALYNCCQAFVFPSFSEGFGWPAIEAQACGAPVIASNVQPMPEISGSGALYCDPKNADEFAKALLFLNEENNRVQMIKRGLENCLRFDKKKMINAYLQLHTINKHN